MIEQDGTFVTFICNHCSQRVTVIAATVALAAREAHQEGWYVNDDGPMPVVLCPAHNPRVALPAPPRQEAA